MNTQQIICIAILAILFVAIVIYKKKTTPTEQQKLEVKEFLDKVTDSLLIVIKNTITNTKPDSYLDLETFLNDVYLTMYEEAWIEVEKQINDIFGNRSDYGIIVKLVDRETIESLVNSLIVSESVEDKLSAVFEETFKAKFEAMEEEEKKAAQIAEAYENGTIVPDEEYVEEPEEKVEVKEEELPEKVEYDPENDDTVELLESTEE